MEQAPSSSVALQTQREFDNIIAQDEGCLSRTWDYGVDGGAWGSLSTSAGARVGRSLCRGHVNCEPNRREEDAAFPEQGKYCEEIKCYGHNRLSNTAWALTTRYIVDGNIFPKPG